MGLYDFFIVTSISFVTAFVSGLVGIGGAILVVPLLLYLPPIAGAVELDMKIVTGISTVHVFFASLAGTLYHHKKRLAARNLVLYMGSGILIGSFLGAVFSRFMGEYSFKLIFASLASLASFIMLFSTENESDSLTSGNTMVFSKTLAFLLAFATGLPIGIIGAGGAFILIPLMLFVLKIPVRIAIGSSLQIVLLSSIAGLIGKASVGQIPLHGAAAVFFGAVPGSLLGAISSGKVSSRSLRMILSLIISLVAVQMWSEALSYAMSIAVSHWVIFSIVGALLSTVLLVVKLYRSVKIKRRKQTTGNTT